MITNLDPTVIFLKGHFVNLETVEGWDLLDDTLIINIKYLTGDMQLLQFDSLTEYKDAVFKLGVGMEAMLYEDE